MPLKQVKQYQASSWLSGCLIVQIFPPICFQKQRQLNKRGMIARFDFRKEVPPISLLGNSVNFLLTPQLLIRETACFFHKQNLFASRFKAHFSTTGNPLVPAKWLYDLGAGLNSPSIWSILGPEQTLGSEGKPLPHWPGVQSLCPERLFLVQDKVSNLVRQRADCQGAAQPWMATDSCSHADSHMQNWFLSWSYTAYGAKLSLSSHGTVMSLLNIEARALARALET